MKSTVTNNASVCAAGSALLNTSTRTASSASACCISKTRSRTSSGPRRFIGGAAISTKQDAPILANGKRVEADWERWSRHREVRRGGEVRHVALYSRPRCKAREDWGRPTAKGAAKIAGGCPDDAAGRSHDLVGQGFAGGEDHGCELSRWSVARAPRSCSEGSVARYGATKRSCSARSPNSSRFAMNASGSSRCRLASAIRRSR